MKYNKIVAHHNVTPVDLAAVGEAKKEKSGKTSVAQKVKRTKAKKRVNMHLEHKPSEENDLLITEINEADLGWTADVCKYQKHHKLYGPDCDKDSLILAQTKKDEETENVEE